MTAGQEGSGATQPGAAAVPQLSVVVAAVDVEETIGACLTALLTATAHLAVEIVLVHASTDRTADRVAAFPSVRAIAAAPGTLVPHLWARGYHASHSRFVAFTLGQLSVSPTWADRLLAAMTGNVAGAGGAFALGPHTRPSSWALFYLRYSAFVEARWRDGVVDGEIAGDNALYRRRELEACRSFEHTGFWEVEIHRELRQRGLTLAAASGAAAMCIGDVSPRRVLRERLRHGRRFGASRAGTLAARVRIVVAAPLVPAVLFLRAARRVWPVPDHRRRLLGGAGWMWLFASAWALGEAAGALFGAGPES
jgi:hypothetical protein